MRYSALAGEKLVGHVNATYGGGCMHTDAFANRGSSARPCATSPLPAGSSSALSSPFPRASSIVGGSAAVVTPVACAMEMVHTMSLIHDDMPCMDEDALRHGRPIEQVAFGEYTALLSGNLALSSRSACCHSWPSSGTLWVPEAWPPDRSPTRRPRACP
ncbi:hypothetical protein QYE76_065862 [Lolium multiflorum]|jgi:geranylgeranyl pyrophosphate synthase|uniref:Geranylgeranyl diphosphate synthase n=1 Tax=Lolium multiflorum TaxID=4521 RepID=A0AAD8SBP1_LOLMU|nr:hypothetical protein QYE76_065862 [Lolium multiflorum]